MPVTLSAVEFATFARDGVVRLRNAFPLECMKELPEATDEAMAKPSVHCEDFASEQGGRFFTDILLAERFPAFCRFANDSPAAEIAGRIMGARYARLFYDQIFVKEPGTPMRTPWHQDQPYWPVCGEQMCSIWLPLDTVSRETSVEYICGSHHWPEHAPCSFGDGEPYESTGLPDMPDIEAYRDQYRIASFVLEPGDCIVFHSRIVHGAPGNKSTRRRRAVITRWLGEDVRFRGSREKERRNDGNPLSECTSAGIDKFPMIWVRD